MSFYRNQMSCITKFYLYGKRRKDLSIHLNVILVGLLFLKIEKKEKKPDFISFHLVDATSNTTINLVLMLVHFRHPGCHKNHMISSRLKGKTFYFFRLHYIKFQFDRAPRGGAGSWVKSWFK